MYFETTMNINDGDVAYGEPKMRLNRLQQSSTSREQEEACRRFFLPEDINRAKWGLTFFYLPIFSFIINDYILFGVSLQLASFALIRVLMFLATLFAIINVRKTTSPASYDRMLFFASATMLICGGIINFFRPENFVAQAILTAVSLFVVYLVIPFRFKYQCLLGTVATIGESIIVILIANPATSVIFTVVASLFFANLVAAFSSQRLQSYRRNACSEFQKRVKAQEELEKSNQNLESMVAEKSRELKKTERLAAIGSTASMVGHDLRNPLTAIMGAAYYLQKNYGQQLDSNGQEMITLIQQNVKFSDKIINDLLDYSREIHLEKTKTNPDSIVQEALSLVNVPSTIHVNRQAENVEVTLDHAKIKRVFANLVKNAVDAMPNGGKLEIRIEAFDGGARIIFADTGLGVSEENQKNLFQPLFTTKAKGMGFGLAICQRIVEAHNGKINIKSTQNKGTIVTVDLPTKP
jgi:signal transduction histidine kinase